MFMNLFILTRNLVDLARYICYFKRLSHASVSMRISYILDCEQLIIKVIIYLNVEELNFLNLCG